MKIIYLHQHFRTPSMSGGTRSYEFAKRLVASGHTVEMIAAWPDETTPAGKSDFTTEEDGIRVHWIRCPYQNRMGYARRLVAFAHFAVSAAIKANGLGGDVVFATSTPLTIALPALYVSVLRHIPMIFEVRDLWPDAPIAIGALRSPILVGAARWLEAAAYRRSAHIIALSPAIKDGIHRRGVSESKITVIPNSADLDLFSPDIDGAALRAEMGLLGKFVCLHLGAMGQVNGLDFVLDCARELRSREIDNVIFLLHGDGSERIRLERLCSKEGLTNVVFSGPSDKRFAARVLAMADVSLTLVKNIPALHACSPNKFFDTLAAGKPALINVCGWLERLTVDERIGLFVRPDDVRHFAEQIIFLRDHPELRTLLGRRARLLAESQYARDRLAKTFERVLITTVTPRALQLRESTDGAFAGSARSGPDTQSPAAQ